MTGWRGVSGGGIVGSASRIGVCLAGKGRGRTGQATHLGSPPFLREPFPSPGHVGRTRAARPIQHLDEST